MSLNIQNFVIAIGVLIAVLLFILVTRISTTEELQQAAKECPGVAVEVLGAKDPIHTGELWALISKCKKDRSNSGVLEAQKRAVFASPKP